MPEVVEFGVASELAPIVSRVATETRQPLRNAKANLGEFLVALDRNKDVLPPEIQRAQQFLAAAHVALVAADNMMSYAESAAEGQDLNTCRTWAEASAANLVAAGQQLPPIEAEK